MMAALVLVNNIVNAICVGMTSGVTVSICLARYRLSPFTTRTAGGEKGRKSYQMLSVNQDHVQGACCSDAFHTFLEGS